MNDAKKTKTQLINELTVLRQRNAHLEAAEAEHKSLEDQLCQGQKMAAVGTLAGSIAHEFNNMLAAIIGFTEMATYEISQASPAYHYLQEVHKAGLRAKDLVQQILTFSRKNDREHKPVQLSLLVKETVKFLRASLPATIDIRQRIPYDVGAVMADPTQMHQILINLCINAEYAMRETGGLLEIGADHIVASDVAVTSPRELRPGPYIRLTVRDTGHGIAPEIVERIFEPFFTTKGVGEGTGMGLAIVKSIVTRHGGMITVESTPGAGTTFAIYLPRIDQTAEREPQTEVPVPYGQGRILFVDDDDALVRLWQSMLARLVYEVLVSSSSSEALKIFQTAPYSFDLVITDQTMPHMTGEVLAAELRRIRPDIPIVLCTGFSHSIQADKAQAIGIDAFLMKPLRAQELGLAVRQALAQRATLETSAQ
jgi:signal transduction histidine kinase/CheY-like chemotaxis protein